MIGLLFLFFFWKKCSIPASFCFCLMVKVRLTCLCWICFTAYKCRCTRKGPKIRYKDVQKLEIKPKHPYCQEKMILWVRLFISLFSFHILYSIFCPPLPLPSFSPSACLPDTLAYIRLWLRCDGPPKYIWQLFSRYQNILSSVLKALGRIYSVIINWWCNISTPSGAGGIYS